MMIDHFNLCSNCKKPLICGEPIYPIIDKNGDHGILCKKCKEKYETEA